MSQFYSTKQGPATKQSPPTRQGPLLLTMNFQAQSMMLNEGVLDYLERPRHVQILMNEETKMLALRPCEVDSSQAVVLPEGSTLQVEIAARSLLRRIRKIAGWKTNQPRVCVGTAVPEYRAVCFAFEEAIALSKQ